MHDAVHLLWREDSFVPGVAHLLKFFSKWLALLYPDLQLSPRCPGVELGTIEHCQLHAPFFAVITHRWVIFDICKDTKNLSECQIFTTITLTLTITIFFWTWILKPESWNVSVADQCLHRFQWLEAKLLMSGRAASNEWKHQRPIISDANSTKVTISYDK